MRIIHVLGKISENYTSGIANHVIDLASYQKEDGHEVLLISYLKKENINDRYLNEFNSIPIINLDGKSGHDVAICGKLFLAIKAFKPDIIHYHTIPIIAFLCHLPYRKYKIINTFHVIEFSKTHELVWRFFINGIICVSPSCLNSQNPDEKRFKKSLWTVVYNGINRKKFQAANFNFASSPLRLIMVCRIDKMKNPDHGVLITKILNELYEVPTELTIVGNGEYADELREFIKINECDKYINLVGFSKNAEKYLANAHFFLLLSWWESFSLSALEALSCGVPVISYQIKGGFMDWFKDGIYGKIATENSPQNVAEIIYALYKDKISVQAMSNKGLQFADELDMKTKSREIVNFYQQVTERND